MFIWGGEDGALVWKICLWVYWPLTKHSVGTAMYGHLFIFSWCLTSLQVIRTTCSKKLVVPVEAANILNHTSVFTRFISGVQESLTGQGGNILNKPTCLSIGLTQLYVYCSTVYQLRPVQACDIIGTLLQVTLVDLQFCQHHTVWQLWSTFSYKGLVEIVFFFDAPPLPTLLIVH